MANRIPQSFIQDLIAQSDIIEIIQSRLNLTKRGKEFIACCPFHNEKTPSFSVSPKKQFYYCFGCGAHGNAIDFLINYHKWTFLEVVEELSAKLAIEIPHTNKNAQDNAQYQHFYQVLTTVNRYYQTQLRQSQTAINYLKSRGINGQTAKHFEIGFAPNDWRYLDALSSDHHDALVKNGLLITPPQKSAYPRFRNRVMFPIHDTRGRTIAFGGRSLNSQPPKYMNSPETAIFHKSHILYGLHRTLQHHHKVPRFLIVEGYMDVISLHQHQVPNAVATLGTATNPKHLQLLFRYSNEVVFCFDGDHAGQQAAWKALTMSLPLLRDGIHIRFMFLPNGDDPDTLVRRVGSQGFNQRLSQAAPLNEVFFKHLSHTIPLTTPDNKAAFAKEAAQYLSQMPEGLFKKLLYEELADHLGVYLHDLSTLTMKEGTTHNKLNQHPNTPNKSLRSPAYKAIALLLQEPRLSFEIKELDRIPELHIEGIELLALVATAFKTNTLHSIGSLLNLCNAEQQRTIAELSAHSLPFPPDKLRQEFQDIIQKLFYLNKEHNVERLIAKAKTTALSTKEKETLNKLLTETRDAPI